MIMGSFNSVVAELALLYFIVQSSKLDHYNLISQRLN